MEILSLLKINLEWVYLKTILISIKYLCLYFVIRDGYTTFQNYLLSKYQKVSYIRAVSIMTIILLIFAFKITILLIIIFNIILDVKLNIRTTQTNIINNYINSLLNK